MSLASVLDQNKDEYFAEINCAVLNAGTVNATTINGGGGGGGISSVTSSDSSLTVTPLNSGATINLTNAGQKWSTFNATTGVNLANHAINNVYSIGIGNGSLGYTGNILTYTASGTAHYYDDHYNQPTMSDVAGAGSSAGGYNITDVGSLACNSLSCPAISGVSTINGSAYPPSSTSVTHAKMSFTSATGMEDEVVMNTNVAGLLPSAYYGTKTQNSGVIGIWTAQAFAMPTGGMSHVRMLINEVTFTVQSSGSTYSGGYIFYLTTLNNFNGSTNTIVAELSRNINPPIINGTFNNGQQYTLNNIELEYIDTSPHNTFYLVIGQMDITNFGQSYNWEINNMIANFVVDNATYASSTITPAG